MQQQQIEKLLNSKRFRHNLYLPSDNKFIVITRLEISLIDGCVGPLATQPQHVNECDSRESISLSPLLSINLLYELVPQVANLMTISINKLIFDIKVRKKWKVNDCSLQTVGHQSEEHVRATVGQVK